MKTESARVAEIALKNTWLLTKLERGGRFDKGDFKIDFNSEGERQFELVEAMAHTDPVAKERAADGSGPPCWWQSTPVVGIDQSNFIEALDTLHLLIMTVNSAILHKSPIEFLISLSEETDEQLAGLFDEEVE